MLISTFCVMNNGSSIGLYLCSGSTSGSSDSVSEISGSESLISAVEVGGFVGEFFEDFGGISGTKQKKNEEGKEVIQRAKL